MEFSTKTIPSTFSTKITSKKTCSPTSNQRNLHHLQPAPSLLAWTVLRWCSVGSQAHSQFLRIFRFSENFLFKGILRFFCVMKGRFKIIKGNLKENSEKSIILYCSIVSVHLMKSLYNFQTIPMGFLHVVAL